MPSRPQLSLVSPRTRRSAWVVVFATLLSTLIVSAVGISSPAVAQPPSDAEQDERAAAIRAQYTKREVRIPMRDGTRLFTSIYTPNAIEGGPWPILMMRTPYSVGPYGADAYKRRLGPTRAFEDKGYIFVFQDVRGTYLSEGEFVNMRPHVPKPRSEKTGPQDVDESTDTYDTIDWLIEHLPGHNGRVGQWGISYPGFYTSAGAIDSHPNLVAVSPQAPIADWFFDDMHHHGAFVLPLAFNFFSSFGQPRPKPTTERAERFEHETADGYRFFAELGPLQRIEDEIFDGGIPFWTALTEHPNYDEFWQSRAILPHLDNIDAAVLVVGGWFDMEDLYGPLRTYESIERKNPGTWNGLVMGPWRHGGWARGDGSSFGDAEFGFPTSDFYSLQVIEPFFEHYLHGEGEDASNPLPEATVFETGANRWRRFASWPPEAVEERLLYLREGSRPGWGGLSWKGPPETASTEPSSESVDRWVSDPSKPVPYTTAITNGWHAEYMTEDQRFASSRPDVLVYESEPLEEDLTLAGPLEAELWVDTTGRDADWVVKLIDVYPQIHPDAEDDPEAQSKGGYQMMVRSEVLRGRFRDGYETPVPFEPGVATRVRVPLQDVLHTFQRGHRIMVHVQSTWFPLIDRNPQSWVDNIFRAEADDFVTATHGVHRSVERPSALRVRVLPADEAWADR